MAPSPVTDDDVLSIWRSIEANRQRVRFATTKFRVGQDVRISKLKMKFAQPAEHNFNTEIFRILKVIVRRPQAIYELEDLNGSSIDGQFYQDVLTPYALPFGRLIT